MPTPHEPPLYSERLWPAPWLYLATALVIPASLLVFLPISPVVGAVVAVVLYAGCVLALIAAATAVDVDAAGLTVGRARLPLDAVGAASAHRGSASAERGPSLDARAWLHLRGWVAPVVKVENTDATDPAPYWLFSSRHPEAVVAALETAKAGRP
ncbi:DUF3093 domain-containing protein [Galbitalea sp. SE-J8]|uniref:DUF3093 domain-containing protein n=1 Tax=Galbitalea sp. SE-J8 TaxID=3054952 RepID=UPI00259D11F5|nr:DUF3093 domain-containing protein [Galbitalea sp. SE-J8]MDM4763199.1 DUF3093 domain-containing protein [Galbitalea sp. SE-J8]